MPEQQERKSNGAQEDRPELTKKQYERELRKLQTKLVEMQEWVIANRTKVVVVFEGRDAAGKGGNSSDHGARESSRLPPRSIAGSDGT